MWNLGDPSIRGQRDHFYLVKGTTGKVDGKEEGASVLGRHIGGSLGKSTVKVRQEEKKY